jgi:hypothetical protein
MRLLGFEFLSSVLHEILSNSQFHSFFLIIYNTLEEIIFKNSELKKS